MTDPVALSEDRNTFDGIFAPPLNPASMSMDDACRLNAKLYVALRAMMGAYERRIRSDCTPEQLLREPWKVAEWHVAEGAIKSYRRRTVEETT